jgi:hypothetical protein
MHATTARAGLWRRARDPGRFPCSPNRTLCGRRMRSSELPQFGSDFGQFRFEHRLTLMQYLGPQIPFDYCADFLGQLPHAFLVLNHLFSFFSAIMAFSIQ